MSKIREKIMADYRKEIEILDIDVSHYQRIFNNVQLKIKDNNRKYFKKHTLYRETIDEIIDFQWYIDKMVDEYIENRIGHKIRKLEISQELLKFKKESGIGK